MSDETPNPDEGAGSAGNIDEQDLAGDRTGKTGTDHKVDDLAKAGRDDMDTDDDQVAEGRWKSTTDGSGTSETD
jgi:hypothetical protein